MIEPDDAPVSDARLPFRRARAVSVLLPAGGVAVAVLLLPEWSGGGTAHGHPPGHVVAMLLAGVFAVLVASLFAALWLAWRAGRGLRAENDRLRALAALDPMTMLGNRRSFDEALPIVWRAAARTRGLLSLILLDADHFKRFNDRFGHLEGDRVLRTLAAVLTAELRRPDDRAFRIGGEEFALLLPGTDAAGAAHVAAAIRTGIARAGTPAGDDDGRRLTVSMGIAQARPDANRPGEAHNLFAAADRALYEAKDAGRDRIRVAALLPGASAPVPAGNRSLIDGVEILLGGGRAIRVGRPIGIETLRALLDLLVDR